MNPVLLGVLVKVDERLPAPEDCLPGRFLAHRHQKVLIVSSSEVYGKSSDVPFQEDQDVLLGPTVKPRWSYAATKALDEFLALAYHRQRGLSVVITRLLNVIGTKQSGQHGMVVPRFVQQALSGQPLSRMWFVPSSYWCSIPQP